MEKDIPQKMDITVDDYMSRTRALPLLGMRCNFRATRWRCRMNSSGSTIFVIRRQYNDLIGVQKRRYVSQRDSPRWAVSCELNFLLGPTPASALRCMLSAACQNNFAFYFAFSTSAPSNPTPRVYFHSPSSRHHCRRPHTPAPLRHLFRIKISPLNLALSPCLYSPRPPRRATHHFHASSL